MPYLRDVLCCLCTDNVWARPELKTQWSDIHVHFTLWLASCAALRKQLNKTCPVVTLSYHEKQHRCIICCCSPKCFFMLLFKYQCALVILVVNSMHVMHVYLQQTLQITFRTHTSTWAPAPRYHLWFDRWAAKLKYCRIIKLIDLTVEIPSGHNRACCKVKCDIYWWIRYWENKGQQHWKALISHTNYSALQQ